MAGLDTASTLLKVPVSKETKSLNLYSLDYLIILVKYEVTQYNETINLFKSTCSKA